MSIINSFLLLFFVFVFAVTFLEMYVKSEGCEDTYKTAGTCGIAYIKVQNVERSLKSRGHNTVVADGTTGMLRMQSFFATGSNVAAWLSQFRKNNERVNT